MVTFRRELASERFKKKIKPYYETDVTLQFKTLDQHLSNCLVIKTISDAYQYVKITIVCSFLSWLHNVSLNNALPQQHDAFMALKLSSLTDHIVLCLDCFVFMKSNGNQVTRN